MSIQVDLSYFQPFYSEKLPEGKLERLQRAHDQLLHGTGLGSDFLGWVDLPIQYDREEFARIQKAAEKIRAQSQVLVVVGIGGSYLGARAAIEFLCSPNYNLLCAGGPQIFFAGNHLTAAELEEIVQIIGQRDFSINVISKSGSTTEPAIAFRYFKKLAEERYGQQAKERIFATTDRARGALHDLAVQSGYEMFVVPDDIGGRFSVLTAVGLLPIAAAGVDIAELMAGAAQEREELLVPGAQNAAWQYAAARHTAYEQGKQIEVLACYEPRFRFVAEWWKQLYGESEGKDGKGLFPASVELTADLHSLGQFIQQGTRNLMETVVSFQNPVCRLAIEATQDDGDGLNYLAGRDMDFVNKQAQAGTILAHVDGGVPNVVLTVADVSPRSLGQLFYFFEFSCGLSGYLLEVNPFNQPGVEQYKKNMFALLGKPGYEQQQAQLQARMK